MFSHHPNNPTNLNLQLQLNLSQLIKLQIHQAPQAHSFINIASSPTTVLRILHSLPNSVHPQNINSEP